MFSPRFVLAVPFIAVYDDPPPAGDPKPGDPKPGDPKPPANQTFTQEQVNAMLADDRRKHQTQIQKETEKHIKQLEDLQKSKTLSDKEKSDLQGRIEELNNSLLTKEQLAAKEKEKLEVNFKEREQKLTSEREMWQGRFIKSTINQAILSEAAKAEAFDPDSLIKLLSPDTRLVEDMDTEGKGLDTFTPKIKFNDVDAEGKSVALDMTVEQTIKRMKEIPRYGYLFKSTAKGGVGTDPPVNKAGVPDVAKMSPEQYRAYRQKAGMAKKPLGA